MSQRPCAVAPGILGGEPPPAKVFPGIDVVLVLFRVGVEGPPWLGGLFVIRYALEPVGLEPGPSPGGGVDLIAGVALGEALEDV